ncbi:major facilitator superfamily domain-containing protein [Boletus coccyginus]|nr:major facilitator superfamily domain-containing protein [Boletus coccyginus]
MDTELAKNPLAELSAARKIVLLFLFCLSPFLDTFNSAALFSAIPVIATSTGLNNSQSVWLNSAYQLSFAALLLISGRMSDIYNPMKLFAEIIFLSGVYLIGFSSLGMGFARSGVVILVLRAFSGIGAALCIPPSLHLLIHTFPDPVIQAKAVSAFAGSGALGNGESLLVYSCLPDLISPVLGVIIGALIISYATWPWVFYTIAIVALFIAITCTFLIPNPHPQNNHCRSERFRRLDLFGSMLLMAALVLFIFAVTSGSTDGWKTSVVLVPLSLSVLLFFSFFVWEARIPEDQASLPPRMWSYPNFAPLVILALLPYGWWGTVYLLFAWYWQEVEFWSAIDSGIHFLPVGLFALPFMALSGVFQQRFDAKYVLLGGLVLMVAGTIFFPFADNTSRYWPIVFPGFLLGTAGTTIVFATANIAIFTTTPPVVAGTVGAVFSCGLHLGNAVMTSVATSIQTTVQPSPTSFKGRAAAFEFFIAFIVLQIISVLVFVRKTGTLPSPRPELGSGSPASNPALEEAK